MFLTALRRPGHPGFTMVEVLFAIGILAVALLGVAGMFPAALRSVITGGQTSKATTLAREMIDMMQADAFDNLDTVYSGFNTDAFVAGLAQTASALPCPVAPPGPGASGGPTYNTKKWTCDLLAGRTGAFGQGLIDGVGSIRVDCVNPDGRMNATQPCPTGLRQVTVTVTWGSQGSRSVKLVTYVAKTH